MNNLWQLKKISTGEALSDPQKLPENWGPIFGMRGVIEKINDLSWLGDEFQDKGWFIVGDAPPDPVEASKAELQWDRSKKLLLESDWSVLPDVPMTSGKKAEWIEYRRKLREIRLQAGFPNEIQWPTKPE